MAANINPIFGRQPHVEVIGAVLNVANTALDGSGTHTVIYQADTTNGSFVDAVVLKPIGSPVATVARVFICSVTGAFTPGTTNTTANTALIAEVTMPAATVSQTAAQNEYTIPIRRPIPAGYRLLLSFGTAAGASNGYGVSTWGSDY